MGKKPWVIALSAGAVLLVACVVLLLTARSEEEIARELAIVVNTPEVYEAYLKDHPDSPATAEMAGKLEECRYQATVREGSEASCRSYLDCLPKGAHAEEVRGILEARVYARVSTQASSGVGTEPLREYLEEFPEGENASAGRRLLESLHFSSAMEDSTETGAEHPLLRFLEAHPDAPTAGEVRARAEEIWYARISADSPPDQAEFSRFLEWFPDGRHADMASLALRAAELWEKHETTLQEIMAFEGRDVSGEVFDMLGPGVLPGGPLALVVAGCIVLRLSSPAEAFEHEEKLERALKLLTPVPKDRRRDLPLRINDCLALAKVEGYRLFARYRLRNNQVEKALELWRLATSAEEEFSR